MNKIAVLDRKFFFPFIAFFIICPCASLLHGFPFVLPDTKFTEVEGFSLYQVDAKPELKIRYRVYRSEGIYPMGAVVFGQLSREQFHFLSRTYGNGTSHVPYSPERRYEIMDFLPPAAQALNGHQFVVEDTPGGPLACNCWGTAYEMARGEDSIALFFTEPENARKLLFDSSYSQHVDAISPMYNKTFVPILKSGDLMIYTVGNALKHVAVFIDKNLFFEMSGYNSDYPYRLVLGTGENRHPDFLELYKVDIRRYGGAQRKPLPHPSQVFTYRGQPLVYRDVKFEYISAGPFAGRAKLPDEVYHLPAQHPQPLRILSPLLLDGCHAGAFASDL